LPTRLKNLTADNQATEQGFAEQSAAAEAHAHALVAKESEFARAALEASELTFAHETQRVEIIMHLAAAENFHGGQGMPGRGLRP
jgi:hypothetical protein